MNGLGYSFYEPHSYNNLYLWRNYTQHYANCSCGSNRIEGHAVPAGAFNGGNQYATCLVCGGLASIGFVGPLVFDDLPITSNGSFILPNGVTVLAEDDYVAYFDGALTFNYQGLN